MISLERCSQRFWQLKALGGFVTWLPRFVFGSTRQGLRGQEIHRLQARFSTASMSGCLGGNDLSLELIFELPQCLLLMNGILMVESRLLLIAIRLGLLLLNLFFHVSEHLKELVFLLLRWLDTSGYLLRGGGVDVLDSM